MNRSLRTAFLAIAASAALLHAGAGLAQTFPSKTARIVVPLTAGGLVDVLARGIAAEFTRLWGQQVIVENRPGANTIVAASFVAKAPADGYTMLLSNPAAVSINQYLYKKLPYDPEKDLALVYNIATAPSVIVVHPSVPANTLQEFIALAKAKPGELAYGSFGTGSTTHFETELLSQRTGIKMNHIPFKGVAEMLPALVGGQIQMAFSGVPPSMSLIRANRIKPIAFTARNRSPQLPEVPTLAEAGVPGLVFGGWFGMVVPSGTPRPIIDRIAADLAQICDRADFKEKYITGVGLVPQFMGPDQFAEFVLEDRARYSQLVKSLNLSLD